MSAGVLAVLWWTPMVITFGSRRVRGNAGNARPDGVDVRIHDARRLLDTLECSAN